MSSNTIYIWKDEDYDHSRWLSLGRRIHDTCVLHLANLCQPGKLSRLASVTCPMAYLKDSLERGGSLQVTLPTGFVLLQRREDVVHLEFRAIEDVLPVRVSFKVEDILVWLAETEDADRIALAV